MVRFAGCRWWPAVVVAIVVVIVIIVVDTVILPHNVTGHLRSEDRQFSGSKAFPRLFLSPCSPPVWVIVALQVPGLWSWT